MIKVLIFILSTIMCTSTHAQTAYREFTGYMVCLNWEYIFVPCGDTNTTVFDAIETCNKSSFVVQHSLGCGKGLHHREFDNLGDSLEVTLVDSNCLNCHAMLYYYPARIKVDLFDSDSTVFESCHYKFSYNENTYGLSGIWYDYSELMDIILLTQNVRQEYIKRYYKKRRSYPDWANEKDRAIISQHH